MSHSMAQNSNDDPKMLMMDMIANRIPQNDKAGKVFRNQVVAGSNPLRNTVYGGQELLRGELLNDNGGSGLKSPLSNRSNGFNGTK